MQTVIVTLANAANETRTFTAENAKWTNHEGCLRVHFGHQDVGEFASGTWKYVILERAS